MVRELTRGRAAGTMSVVDQYLDWQLQSGGFATAALVRSPSRTGSTAIEGYDLPMVVTTAERAAQNRQLLVRKSHRGFEVLFGSRTSSPDIEEFFAARGFRETTTSSMDAFFEQAWTAHALRHAVELMQSLRVPVAVCFSHDDDPIFLLDLVAHDSRTPPPAK